MLRQLTPLFAMMFIFSAGANTPSNEEIYQMMMELKKEIAELKAENKKLKELIGDEQNLTDGIISKVLIDKDGKFLKSIILNKGTKDGIKIGMVVLENCYLVGQIIETNYTTSRAILISDLNSNIPVVLEPGSFQSILSGTGKDYGKIKYSKNKLELLDIITNILEFWTP